jgi:hypothetical protein
LVIKYEYDALTGIENNNLVVSAFVAEKGSVTDHEARTRRCEDGTTVSVCFVLYENGVDNVELVGSGVDAGSIGCGKIFRKETLNNIDGSRRGFCHESASSGVLKP